MTSGDFAAMGNIVRKTHVPFSSIARTTNYLQIGRLMIAAFCYWNYMIYFPSQLRKIVGTYGTKIMLFVEQGLDNFFRDFRFPTTIAFEYICLPAKVVFFHFGIMAAKVIIGRLSETNIAMIPVVLASIWFYFVIANNASDMISFHDISITYCHEFFNAERRK